MGPFDKNSLMHDTLLLNQWFNKPKLDTLWTQSFQVNIETNLTIIVNRYGGRCKTFTLFRTLRLVYTTLLPNQTPYFGSNY